MNRVIAAGLLAGLAAAVGCFKQETATTSTSRSQAADDDGKDSPLTVGAKTVVGNVDPIPVTGVGLVHNLRGTGSSPPPGDLRAALENTILKLKGNPKELLDDPARTTSLVLVSAVIPPGARVGEKIDVTVSLPPGSRTTSLRGGVLVACDLSNFEFAGNVRQAMTAAGIPTGKVPAADGAALKGSRMVVAGGPLVSLDETPDKPADDADAPEKPRLGRVAGGGRVLIDRPYYLLLADGSPQPRLAMVVAERLNSVFHAPGDRTGRLAEAKVQGRPLVVTAVPPAYRMNHPRFLLVARQVPLAPVEADGPYRKALEYDLTNPNTALTAAIKLEALGPDSRQPLRVGLQSDSPWVRFAAAEALAYLGHADGAKDLGELAEKHPALRPQCLTALASLDDAVCLDQLAELMKKGDPALRYGAFAALRAADPTHEAVRAGRRGGWLTAVAPDAAPLAHVGTLGRPEVVLFGPCPVRGPFSIPLGNTFTVTCKDGETAVTVTRVTTKNGEPVAVPVTVRPDLGLILAAVGDLGGGYPEAVALVRRLQKEEAVVGAVAFDATPRALTVQQLAVIARSDPALEKANAAVEAAAPAGDVQQAAYTQQLPTDADAVQAKPEAAPPAAPNREPGRLFGPGKK